jgi:hypothetical protein
MAVVLKSSKAVDPWQYSVHPRTSFLSAFKLSAHQLETDSNKVIDLEHFSACMIKYLMPVTTCFLISAILLKGTGSSLGK